MGLQGAQADDQDQLQIRQLRRDDEQIQAAARVHKERRHQVRRIESRLNPWVKTNGHTAGRKIGCSAKYYLFSRFFFFSKKYIIYILTFQQNLPSFLDAISLFISTLKRF